MQRSVAWSLFGALVVLTLAAGRRMLAPVRGRVSAPFGQRRPSGDHNGIDIAVPVGTDVIAPDSGTVTATTYNDRGGMQLVIALDNGYTVGFAHLSRRAPSVGQRVTRGEVVAATGATGNVTGPHLHLTLRNPDGQYVDPAKYFNFG